MDLKQMYMSSEGRISRQQFILWGIGMGIVVGIISSLFNRAGIFGLVVSAIISLAATYFFSQHLIIKRSHDLNDTGTSRWQKIRYVNIAMVVISTITAIILLGSVASISSTQSEMQILQKEMQAATTPEAQQAIAMKMNDASDAVTSSYRNPGTPLTMGLNALAGILGIYSIVLAWPLIFKKGTVGANQYGADPVKTS